MKHLSIGQKINRLTVIDGHTGVKSKARMCRCLCECGVIKEFQISNILLGKSKSCGCLSRQVTISRNKTHGKSKSPEYAVWSRMHSRCTNPIVERYPQYGGRGIRVCTRWNSFDSFFEDMGEMPSNRHSIGRIDNDGNYESSNCRWETKEQQANNKSTNVFIEWRGDRKTYAQWAKATGISYWTIVQRHRSGMPEEKIFDASEDGHNKKSIQVNGVTRLTTEWMASVGIPISSFYYFIRKGLTPEQVVLKYMANAKP